MADALLTAQADGTILEVPGYGKLLIARTTVPADNEIGYARGCLCLHLDHVSPTTSDPPIYVNDTGDKDACNFDQLSAL
jgi:hypothetical protein